MYSLWSQIHSSNGRGRRSSNKYKRKLLLNENEVMDGNGDLLISQNKILSFILIFGY